MSQEPAPILAALERTVRERLGLVFSPARRGALDAGLARTSARLGGVSPAMLLARIQSGDRSVLDALADELTIPETYFFRDAKHFGVVERVAAERGSGPLRMWSAGCATGEEAYSMAITALGVARDSRGLEVLGTDVSPRAVEKARRAAYRPWAFRGVEDDVKRRWFVACGAWTCPAPVVRERVRFAVLNLLDRAASAEAPAGMDVVFCRNVFLYVDADGIAVAAALLRDALAPDGWLVLGPSDPLLDVPGLAVDTTPGFLVYRRCAGSRRTGGVNTRASRVIAAEPSRGAGPRACTARRSPRTSQPPPARPAPIAKAPPPDLDRARALADAGELEAALTILEGTTDERPEVDLLRAFVRQALGDHVAALHHAERVLERDPASLLARGAAAVSRAWLGDLRGAARAVAEARAQMQGLAPDRDLGGGTTVSDLAATLRAVEARLVKRRAARRRRSSG